MRKEVVVHARETDATVPLLRLLSAAVRRGGGVLAVVSPFAVEGEAGEEENATAAAAIKVHLAICEDDWELETAAHFGEENVFRASADDAAERLLLWLATVFELAADELLGLKEYEAIEAARMQSRWRSETLLLTRAGFDPIYKPHHVQETVRYFSTLADVTSVAEDAASEAHVFLAQAKAAHDRHMRGLSVHFDLGAFRLGLGALGLGSLFYLLYRPHRTSQGAFVDLGEPLALDPIIAHDPPREPEPPPKRERPPRVPPQGPKK